MRKVLLIVAALAVAVSVALARSAHATSQTTFIDTTTGFTTWTVPATVKKATFTVYGGSGGKGGGDDPACLPVGPAQPGGRATVTIAVTPGTTYNLFVGTGGAVGACAFVPGGAGGQGGNADENGGDGGPDSGIGGWGGGGGGGGASDVRVGGTGVGNRLIVAGGGGATGGTAPGLSEGAGGVGGGNPADNGIPSGLLFGNGGSGATGSAAGAGGSGGTGTGGVGASGAGSVGGAGGNGTDPVDGAGGGGGGGGGYFGGGGGQAGDQGDGGAGGGGGSGHGPAGTSFTNGVDAGNGGNGKIVIVYGVSSTSVPTRAGYCAAPGDTWLNGAAITPGTFLNLEFGQPNTDPHYTNAFPARYLQAIGIECGEPPHGYADSGHTVDGGGNTGSAAAIYEYWTKP